MSEKSQNNPAIIGKKQGVPIYKVNPSVPDPNCISKKKKVHYGDEQRGFIVDSGSGEIISVGGAGFYEFEEVDNTKFVKLFLAGVKQAAGLSKSGLTLFEIVYRELQEKPGEDKVMLSYYTASEHAPGMTTRTYQRGLRELLNKEFLFRSPSDGVFFVNIRFMFNGDRLAFVKGYRRKGAAVQAELDLDAAVIQNNNTIKNTPPQ
ncbi:hypothetical protein [Flavilitoribacter nigricans]|uniref:Plasmid replication protein RepL domain-containing protein n=1 Tax=Flavilitoribacter nigricans (strain ATCC 23147 / DSM 23189 / NBRC 102662 / NCIMB 1420 / SS-2) TaxID=1122177 RepID=A0A2D0MXB9_FLAN2|nr:hypothetical protein [Flavilitoribacter nigricans]PHN00922.1 hypothetical protein CRP01_39700 [Flavilitoribacter nigricans DSM 23189 = NBRC 102662]